MRRVEIPFLRHGQFDGPGSYERNFTNFAESLSDKSRLYPLTEMGKYQILEAFRQIPNCGQIDLIFVSQYLRTQQSAQVISNEIKIETGREVRIVVSPLLDTIWMPPDSLSEKEFVELEQTGMRTAVADAMFQKWISGQIGESPEMVKARINAFLIYLGEIVDSKLSIQPVVITHASFSSAMLRHVQDLDLTSPRNEEQILKVTGCYLLVVGGDLGQENIGVELSRENFLA